MAATTAREAGIAIVQLPAHGPALNPIEGLWKWMREKGTRSHCFDSVTSLFNPCKDVVARINHDPLEIVNRLWPRFELDRDAEQLLISK